MEKEKKTATVDYPIAISRLTQYVSEKVAKEKKISTELLTMLRAFIEIRNISYVNPGMKREIKNGIEYAINENPKLGDVIMGQDTKDIETIFIKDKHFEVTSYKQPENETTSSTIPKKIVVECDKTDVII
jgi:hypothetical protein